MVDRVLQVGTLFGYCRSLNACVILILMNELHAAFDHIRILLGGSESMWSNDLYVSNGRNGAFEHFPNAQITGYQAKNKRLPYEKVHSLDCGFMIC